MTEVYMCTPQCHEYAGQDQIQELRHYWGRER